MIEDSLDNQLDESQYKLVEIQTALIRIEEVGITPDERAKMIEESYLQKAEERGKLEGKMEGKLEIAKNLLAMGLDIEAIVKATGLTEEMILQ